MNSNRKVALLLVGFMGLGFSYPFIAYFTSDNMHTSDGVLSGNATMRGQYINSGGRDIGPNKDYKPNQRQ